MKSEEVNSCDAFLKWALPKMNLRPGGFKKVRKQVCKRIRRRFRELDLKNFNDYRSFIEDNPYEWEQLDQMTHITISRFFRDKKTWEKLGENLLPEIVKRAIEARRPVRCWSAGFASGEEPYSFLILWKEKIVPDFPGASLELVATDADPHMLKRARRACYKRSSLKEVPEEWIKKAFSRKNNSWCLKPAYRKMVDLYLQDIRNEMPEGEFDLVLCKNLVAMYFKKELATVIFKKITTRIRKGGYLILGSHEEIQLDQVTGLEEFDSGLNIYIRSS